MGGIIPAVFQRFRVEPQELARERPYIARNIDATRKSFALSGVTPSLPGQRRPDPAAYGPTGHDRQHPPVGPEVLRRRPQPPGHRPVLQLHRRRRRPLPDRWRHASGDDLGPRGRPQRLAERPGPGRTCTWPTPTATAWSRSRSTPRSPAASPTSSSGFNPEDAPSRSAAARLLRRAAAQLARVRGRQLQPGRVRRLRPPARGQPVQLRRHGRRAARRHRPPAWPSPSASATSTC